MEALIGIAFIVLVTRFAWVQLAERSPKRATGGRRYSDRGIRNGVRRGSEWAAQRTARKPTTTARGAGETIVTGPWEQLRNAARKWGDYEIRKGEERASRPAIARRLTVPFYHPHDELAPRRERKNAARQDAPSTASSPAGPQPPDQSPSSEPSGGNQPAMSHTNGSGAGADLFSALQQVVSQARSGGLQAKHRAIKTFAEALDHFSQTLQQFSQEMAEPDQGYPQQIWEPLGQSAQHLRAAASKASESDAAMTQLSNMQVGELAASSIRAPHQSELNSDTASR